MDDQVDDREEADQRSWAAVCLCPVRFSEPELATMRAHPGRCHEVPLVSRCLLPAGHDEPHEECVIQTFPDLTVHGELWLRWDDATGVRHWFHAECCDAMLHCDTVFDEPCLRPDGHDGPHSFEYRPDRDWPFPDETSRWLPGSDKDFPLPDDLILLLERDPRRGAE